MKINTIQLLFLAFLFGSLSGNAQCLVSQHCFNGNALDNSSNTNNGTVIGATLDTGRTGAANTAYKFSSSDYITLPTTSYNNLNEFSYAAWVNPATIPKFGQIQQIISIGGFGMDQSMGLVNNPPFGFGWFFSTYNSSGGVLRAESGSLPQQANMWYHIACTRTNQVAKLYINGSLVDTTSLGNINAGYANNMVARIGSRYNNGQNWKGLIDDVTIYKCALTASDISALYASKTCDPDTCFFTQRDTIQIFDTLQVTVFDTITYVDTMQVIDTIFHTVFDTVVHYDTVVVYDTIEVGLSQNDFGNGSNKILVFPNPSQGQVVVDLNHEYGDVTYRLETIRGQMVIEEEQHGIVTMFEFNLPEATGIYILSVFSKGELLDRMRLIRD